MWMLALMWRPIVPPSLTAAVVALALALACWVWWRTRRGGQGFTAALAGVLALLMRCVVVAAVGVLLLGPSVVPEATRDDEPRPLYLLVDASASMDVADAPTVDDAARPETRAAFARGRWLAPRLLDDLRAHHDVRLYHLNDRLRVGLPDERGDTDPAPAPPAADNARAMRQSFIADGLGELIGSLPAGSDASVVLLSDGRDSRATDPAAVARLAAARGVKVHTVTLGEAALRRDVSVAAASRQPYLMVNEPGVVDITLRSVAAEGVNATLRIRHDGKEDVRAVALEGEGTPGGGRTALELPVTHADPGLYEYEVSVDALSGELETANNRAVAFVEVTARRMRVLLLEGRPYWDSKFIAQALRRDERIELTALTQISAGKRERVVSRGDGSTDATLPTSYDDLTKYDAIILGRGMESMLGPEVLRDLPRYVREHGGRVVFARGRPYDPSGAVGQAVARGWSVMEPVVWGDGSGGIVETPRPVTLTAEGRTHPAFALFMQRVGPTPSERDLPALSPSLSPLPLKPGTLVLAEVAADESTAASGAPRSITAGIVTMPYGRGMVMAVVGEGLWRWNLASARNAALAGVYDGFWMTAMRWLVLGAEAEAGRDVSLRLSGRSVAVGDELSLRLMRRGNAVAAKPTLTVTDPQGESVTLDLTSTALADARSTAAFTPETTGVHRARVTFETADGSPGIAPLETRFTAFDGNTELLRTASDPRWMRTLAEGSGGRVLDPRRPETLRMLLEGERLARVRPGVPAYVWDQPWVLALLLGWAGGEWLLRRKGGLL